MKVNIHSFQLTIKKNSIQDKMIDGIKNDIMKVVRRFLYVAIIIFIFYFLFANYLSYKDVLVKSVSVNNIISKYFTPEIGVIKIKKTYIKKWTERELLLERERFLAMNANIFLGVEVVDMKFSVEPYKNAYLVSVTFPPVKILSLEMREVVDPDGILKNTAIFNRVMDEAKKYFISESENIVYKKMVYEKLKFEIESIFTNIFPQEKFYFQFFYSPPLYEREYER